MTGWRERVRRTLETVEPVEVARRGRHAVRSGFGRRDRRVARDYLAAAETPRLHLGCGTRLLAGWLNTDLSPRTSASIRVDVTRPLPFADATFAFVYGEHMIEHVDQLHGLALLGELHRVLRPGGVVRLSTPDLGRLLDLFDGPPDPLQQRYLDLFEEHLPASPLRMSPTVLLNHNMRAWGHRFLYDEESFRELLAAGGFDAIERCALQESRHPELAGLANEERMPAGLVDFETMTFEARRT